MFADKVANFSSRGEKKKQQQQRRKKKEKKWGKRRAIYVDVLLKISAYQAEKKEKFHVPP